MRSRANAFRTGNLRREITALAARMMAEDGIDDFGFAKRKAARQLGATEAEALPTNAEIEAELRLYQSLYQDEEQLQRVREMREAAVALMQRLAEFRPYLTGGVLDGTAGRYAEIEIELFPDSAKDVEIFLLNADLSYQHRDVRRGPDAPEAVLALDWQDQPVRLVIRNSVAERSGKRNGVERARLHAVEALLREAEGQP